MKFGLMPRNKYFIGLLDWLLNWLVENTAHFKDNLGMLNDVWHAES